MTLRDDLIATLALLVTHGWTQHVFYDPITDRYSLLGALGRATDRLNSDGMVLNWQRPGCARLDAAAEAVREAVFPGGRNTGKNSIGTWNDHPDRTSEDVLTAIERAIQNT